MSRQDFDIAILGLGPVGSAAAILLAEAGLKVIALDRDREIYRLPRAVNMDGEVIRGFQALGLADSLNALMQPLREGEWVGFVNSRRERLFGVQPRVGGVNGWNTNSFFDQPEVDGWLRQQASAQPNAAIRIGVEVTGFSQDADGVSLDTQDLETGNSQQIRAGYLLGCDGAASMVRRSLGIGWQNLGYDQQWLVIDITLKPGHTLDVHTMQVCDPDRLATYVASKDPYRRWEFKLNDGEDPAEFSSEANVRRLIEAWTPAGTYEIRRSAMYTFHAAVARQWRQGRILIAGDAAHQTPPFLGQGMNAGMRDVLNLAWKFKMIQAGKATDALLDSYQAERDAHARDLVDWAVSIGRLMEFTANIERAERDGTEPPRPMETSSGYGQGRTAPPLRAGIINPAQCDSELPCGGLFSQPKVITNQGEQTWFDTLLGRGFALVHKGQLVLNEEEQQFLAAIDGCQVCTDDCTLVSGRWDYLLENHDAVLVRPDRYVFGFTEAGTSAGDLLRMAAGQLCLTP